MGLFRRAEPLGPVVTAPLVTPQATVDGWTLEGTPLASAVPRPVQRELTTLLHGVAVGVDTAWTYARAVEILETAGELGQAHAVCEAWLAQPAATRPEHAARTRALTRQRDRLRHRLAARSQVVGVS